MDNKSCKLRYDGKYDFLPGDSRQWTLLSHFIDKDGADRYMGSFIGANGLREIGVIKDNASKCNTDLT